MLKNVYTPLSGALAQERVFEILANNLANANTVGFKEENVTFKLLTPEVDAHRSPPMPVANYTSSWQDLYPTHGNEMKYVGVSGVSRNDAMGSAIVTKNPLDVMIESQGYLAVNTTDGLRYTRNGSLAVNPDGILVDKFGSPVSGSNGSIVLGNSKVMINSHGEIYQEGEYIDRLLVFTIEDPRHLEKVGNNYYHYNGPEEMRVEANSPQIQQGVLESSNVNTIKNLTNLILAHRSYEAYQKSIKSYDNIMEKANSSLARVPN